jgi:hypothetical protein
VPAQLFFRKDRAVCASAALFSCFDNATQLRFAGYCSSRAGGRTGGPKALRVTLGFTIQDTFSHYAYAIRSVSDTFSQQLPKPEITPPRTETKKENEKCEIALLLPCSQPFTQCWTCALPAASYVSRAMHCENLKNNGTMLMTLDSSSSRCPRANGA